MLEGFFVKNALIPFRVYWATKKSPASVLYRASQMKPSKPKLLEESRGIPEPFLASPGAQFPFPEAQT
jgi:hypothetical protein